MADVAPLTAAHEHSRKAASETQILHWDSAAIEHENASKDFVRTARTTNDVEALRILKLLEEQHQKLAKIIHSQQAGQDVTVIEEHILPKKHESTQLATPEEPSTRNSAKPSALAAAKVGSQTRDSSPSLARDIASRRGIPQSNRQSPAAQVRARQLSPEASRNRGNAPKIPPSIVDSQASVARAKQARKAKDDEGFANFYSGLTSGTMSKLSSVLAYAGLPLTADEVKPEPVPTSKSGRQTVSASNDPDVRKLFSKAALDAVEEEHRQRGTFRGGFGPAESFYVVPPTGMTTSFADIARRRGLEDDMDDFVNANEVAGPPSPTRLRASQASRTIFGKGRTQEELELENSTLKVTLEQLAGRLANFEAHAQDASMAALTQSMVSVKTPSKPVAGDAGPLDRLRQLEEQVARDAEEKQRLEAQTKQQQRELKKWDSRYTKLYEKAKSRQQAKDVVRKPSEGGENGGAGHAA